MRRLTVRRNGDNFSRRTGPHLEKSMTSLGAAGALWPDPLGCWSSCNCCMYARTSAMRILPPASLPRTLVRSMPSSWAIFRTEGGPAPFPRSMVTKSLGGFRPPQVRQLSFWSRRDVRLRRLEDELGAEFVASLAAVLEPLSMEIRTCPTETSIPSLT